jgi:hypothetical protein
VGQPPYASSHRLPSLPDTTQIAQLEPVCVVEPVLGGAGGRHPRPSIGPGSGRLHLALSRSTTGEGWEGRAGGSIEIEETRSWRPAPCHLGRTRPLAGVGRTSSFPPPPRVRVPDRHRVLLECGATQGGTSSELDIPERPAGETGPEAPSAASSRFLEGDTRAVAVEDRGNGADRAARSRPRGLSPQRTNDPNRHGEDQNRKREAAPSAQGVPVHRAGCVVARLHPSARRRARLNPHARTSPLRGSSGAGHSPRPGRALKPDGGALGQEPDAGIATVPGIEPRRAG